MKHSDDIVNLFQQFGAKADPYHELARKQEHKLSNERWPLVSAVRDAVAHDVPSVDRRAGAAMAPAPQQVQAPVAVRPEPAVELPRAAPLVAEAPRPVAAPVTVLAAAADRLPPVATTMASRSPLARLAGLRAPAAPASLEEQAVPQESLPVDLSSVFARLAGAPVAGSAAPAPAPAWQPRKGHA
ncbi:cellulose biosynthesis protein BcsP [Acidovorax radicis]|uniref:cellulose biosynthesis protein BcsP n=1 Tax=Acidovorax radicis TaxID=758826 RepID=UPI00023766BB|nr:cellulose biosynthesis protein BcsP [Acidovorax radicis]